jgi:V8-like Glu-specific endopeptidase
MSNELRRPSSPGEEPVVTASVGEDVAANMTKRRSDDGQEFLESSDFPPLPPDTPGAVEEDDGEDSSAVASLSLDDPGFLPIFREARQATDSVGTMNTSSMSAASEMSTKDVVPNLGEARRDSRLPVTNPSAVPFRHICFLRIYRKDGKLGRGTAFFVTPRLLITAAHCVTKPANKAAPGAFRIWPGFVGANGAAPRDGAGSIDVQKIFVPDRWSNGREQGFDFAGLVIPKGVNVGFLGLGTFPPAKLRTLPLNLVGYPSDSPGQKYQMMAHQVSGASQEGQLITHKADSSEGQSGAPFFTIETDANGNKQFLVAGIHSGGQGDGRFNRAVAMSDATFKLIDQWARMIPG